MTGLERVARLGDARARVAIDIFAFDGGAEWGKLGPD
jgi:hypothetical protein